MSKTQDAIDRLKTTVVGIGVVAASAVALIGGLAQQIRDAIDDPEELNDLANQLEARQAELAAAVAAGTVAEGEDDGTDTTGGDSTAEAEEGEGAVAGDAGDDTV